jgi:hypothetical protein
MEFHMKNLYEYGIHMEDGVKKEKLLYLFQKSIQIFSLAYSTGKYSPSNSGVIPVSCGVLFAGFRPELEYFAHYSASPSQSKKTISYMTNIN